MKVSHHRDESLHDLSEGRMKPIERKDFKLNNENNQCLNMQGREKKRTANFPDL